MCDIIEKARLKYCEKPCVTCVFNTDENKEWGPCTINAWKMYKKNPNKFFILMRRRKVDFKFLNSEVE